MSGQSREAAHGDGPLPCVSDRSSTESALPCKATLLLCLLWEIPPQSLLDLGLEWTCVLVLFHLYATAAPGDLVGVMMES